MIKMKKIWSHFKTITEHKLLVMKYCFKVGLYKQGLLHDLSKYSPEEFWTGVYYYQGNRSPNAAEREVHGFSKAWLHHKGRNKHHYEYWVDFNSPEVAPVIPYKYMAEMICDKMSASITYNGKNWTRNSEYDYWIKERENIVVNPKIDRFLTEVFTEVKDNGIEKTITKQNIKDLYKKYCIDDKTKYTYILKGEWKNIDENTL